ncbi:unnamed protein product [Staurois parvus]|uniref:Uncharacterized protein n=1 Tax=Staurois parvus TaxID=386267 RepID=A0ABN9BV84_9NEOB|nr:unnamed protein product [Staurois parvus]
MQTASTNICERLCNKSIHEISLLLIILRSTVSGIITKCKQQGAAVTQPQSGRPSKMKLSAESIAKDHQTSCGLQISTTVHSELHGMGFHG